MATIDEKRREPLHFDTVALHGGFAGDSATKAGVAERLRSDVDESTIRPSMGIEDRREILADLTQALNVRSDLPS